jgi:hypothetical protein
VNKNDRGKTRRIPTRPQPRIAIIHSSSDHPSHFLPCLSGRSPVNRFSEGGNCPDSQFPRRPILPGSVVPTIRMIGLENYFRSSHLIQLGADVSVLLTTEAILPQLICKPLFWDCPVQQFPRAEYIEGSVLFFGDLPNIAFHSVSNCITTDRRRYVCLPEAGGHIP